MTKSSTCPRATLECVLLEIRLCRPCNKRTSSSKNAPTIGRRAPTLEQCPGSAETPTLIPKETVQLQRILLNPEHPLFGILPYAELLARLQDPCPRPLHPDQLLLTESARHFIDLRQAVCQEREEAGEYIAPGGIRTSCHNVNCQQH